MPQTELQKQRRTTLKEKFTLCIKNMKMHHGMQAMRAIVAFASCCRTYYVAFFVNKWQAFCLII